jgi:hypothetical protein
MRGSKIIVSSEPQGQLVEGLIATGETPKPGTIVQIDASVALNNGRHTWKIYNADADGGRPKGPYILLKEDDLRGKTYDDAYAAGDRAFGIICHRGDEYNLRLLDVAGTGDDHTKGEILIIDDTTGKMIATTGTPEDEVAVLLETITDPTADTVAWCQWQA